MGKFTLSITGSTPLKKHAQELGLLSESINKLNATHL